MVCIYYCGTGITQSQLDHSQAVKVGRNKYAHLECIDNHTAGTPVIDDRSADLVANTCH